MKIISTNRKAYYNYFIEQTFEAGVSLVGSEVKSIRQGHVSLTDAYVTISKAGEVFVKHMYIKAYEKANSFAPDEKKSRKLLLNKSEIKKLQSKVMEKGFTIVPLKVYLKGSLVKLEIALAKGKHTYNKKQELAKRDVAREVQRELKTLSQTH